MDICLCGNKGADQLCSNCKADQRICFRYSDFKLLAFFRDFTDRFVSDLVGNRFFLLFFFSRWGSYNTGATIDSIARIKIVTAPYDFAFRTDNMSV